MRESTPSSKQRYVQPLAGVAKGAPATATLGANVLIRRRPSLSEPRRRTQTPPAGADQAAEVTKGSRADRGPKGSRGVGGLPAALLCGDRVGDDVLQQLSYRPAIRLGEFLNMLPRRRVEPDGCCMLRGLHRYLLFSVRIMLSSAVAPQRTA
jgi:hypothetical protein